MRYKAIDIMKLLEEVAMKAEMTLEYASFGEIYSKIEEELEKVPFKEGYLYKRVYQKVRKVNDDSVEIRLSANFIEHVARYLGYNNYDQFKKVQAHPVHPILGNYIGTWYSYVRCNSGQEYVLIAPVRIFKEGREIFITLKGNERMFNGKLKFQANCIYCLLESQQDKNLHLVFSVGFSKKPSVLQGVFSGMSTAGDPIAGREVLIRREEKFAVLKNSRRSISELTHSTSEEEKMIGLYFKDAKQNILKGGKSSTFELNDLGENDFGVAQ